MTTIIVIMQIIIIIMQLQETTPALDHLEAKALPLNDLPSLEEWMFLINVSLKTYTLQCL